MECKTVNGSTANVNVCRATSKKYKPASATAYPSMASAINAISNLTQSGNSDNANVRKASTNTMENAKRSNQIQITITINLAAMLLPFLITSRRSACLVLMAVFHAPVAILVLNAGQNIHTVLRVNFVIRYVVTVNASLCNATMAITTITMAALQTVSSSLATNAQVDRPTPKIVALSSNPTL